MTKPRYDQRTPIAPLGPNPEDRLLGSRYTRDQMEKALTYLLACGTSLAAQRAIEDDDSMPNIRAATLVEWSRRHPDLYEQVRQTVGPVLEAKLVDSSRALAARLAEKERELTEAIDPNDDPRKLTAVSGALRNLSTSKALQVDKVMLPLTGRPSSYTAPASPEDNLAALRKMFKAAQPKAIESTTEDAPESPPDAPPVLGP